MTVLEYAPGVFHIEVDYRVYCTLIVGKTLSLLWDTGQEPGALAGYVKNWVNTPLKVLNSHGHADHIGGNGAFDAVYAHPADWPLLEKQGQLTGVRYPLWELLPGMAFDLGDRTAEVVSLAGHTPGSVGLLFERDRLLLAGDALNPTLLLLEGRGDPMEPLRETLTETLALPFDTFLASHYPNPLPKEQVETHLRHMETLNWKTPGRKTPYGGKLLRSGYRDGKRKSVFYILSRV